MLLLSDIFYQLQRPLAWYTPRSAGLKGRPEAIRPFLIFCFFLIKQKEKEEGENPIGYKNYFLKEVWFVKANLRLLDASFFCLETKEPKIQECRIASGRHSAHRAWVHILQLAPKSGYPFYKILLLPPVFAALPSQPKGGILFK